MIKRYSLCIFMTPVMHDKGDWVRYGDYLAEINFSNDKNMCLMRKIDSLENKIERDNKTIDMLADDKLELIDQKDKWVRNCGLMLIANFVLIGVICTGLN